MKKKIIEILIRNALACVLFYFVYQETGWATVLFCVFVTFNFELLGFLGNRNPSKATS